MSLLNDEIRRLGKSGLSESEFESARACVIFDAKKNLDSPESLLRTAAMDSYYGRDPLDMLNRVQRLEAISCQEFNDRISVYFRGAAGVELMVVPKVEK